VSYFVLNNWLWLSFWMSALVPLLLILVPPLCLWLAVFLHILHCFPHVIPQWKGPFHALFLMVSMSNKGKFEQTTKGLGDKGFEHTERWLLLPLYFNCIRCPRKHRAWQVKQYDVLKLLDKCSICTGRYIVEVPFSRLQSMSGLRDIVGRYTFFRNLSQHIAFRNSIGIWNFCVFKLSFLLAGHSKIPFRFASMDIIIICLLIITIWKPCGQHGDSFNHRLWSWMVISFPMALLLPLPLLYVACILLAHTS
jgi:hypothetical protein